ncbi:AAA family ATPase [Flavobacterium sp. SM15]|uniref:AAA family ATPase n=1 Tax=Flavobacterium sp. SM15 TaxID=2908005 RepID=UPI001EDA8B71|nr:AAA family ATPase [Flavobacterium sp. SM15]MCG2612369.1 AAA family ATPase [Flavobacterium sp. SM15]
MKTETKKTEIKSSNRNFKNHSIEDYVVQTIHKHLPAIDSKIEQRIVENIKSHLEEKMQSFALTKKQIEHDYNKKVTVLHQKIANNDRETKKILRELAIKIDQKSNKKTIDISILNGEKVTHLGTQHYQFEQLLRYVSTKENIYLVGVAGCGKTTICQSIAKALEVEFYFTGAINSEYKLTGFINAKGEIVSTTFREAYQNGGLFLFDEIDASFPQAIMAFNAALANDFMDFPDAKVKRHPDFYCIAAANTYGKGADRQYIGRNQLDAATLDRFIFFEMLIDEELEKEIAQNDNWVAYVQRVRKAVSRANIRHLVSPRASYKGAKLLKVGIERNQVEKDVLWNGLDENTIATIKANM